MDPVGSRLIVGELCYRFATRLSSYQCRSASILSSCCGLVGIGELPLSCSGLFLAYFRNGAAGGGGNELPSDCGIAVWRCISGRTLRSFQRKLDANHADHGAAGELAAGMAWTKSGIDQRC